MKQITVTNVILLREGWSERGGSLKRNVGPCQEQSFWSEHLGKALTGLPLSCHNSRFDGSAGTMRSGPTGSSCSVWSFSSDSSRLVVLAFSNLRALHLAGKAMENVSRH